MDLSILSGIGLQVNLADLPQQLVNGLITGSIYALIALGYTMVYGVLRLINFAHGEVFMLGAYAALITSWTMGFTPAALRAGRMESSALNLVIMILVAMAVCAVVGALIELLAYRPMRSQSRIAALITAIGVSLFIQYTGQLFLPNSPPPSIAESVNPYRQTVVAYLSPPPEEVATKLEEAKSDFEEKDAFADQIAEEQGADSEAAIAASDAAYEAESLYGEALNEVRVNSVSITTTVGKLIMLGTVVVLMIGLTYLVMKTKAGRAMRAVSHDFDSASLMGINVNRVVTFTFMLGSALAGAGAMMLTTFEGVTMTTFFGVQPGVKAFVAAVLGGIGNIPGAVLGGLLMGLAETLVTWLGYSNYKDAVAFVILIVVLLVRPGGILGSNKVEKV